MRDDLADAAGAADDGIAARSEKARRAVSFLQSQSKDLFCYSEVEFGGDFDIRLIAWNNTFGLNIRYILDNDSDGKALEILKKLTNKIKKVKSFS